VTFPQPKGKKQFYAAACDFAGGGERAPCEVCLTNGSGMLRVYDGIRRACVRALVTLRVASRRDAARRKEGTARCFRYLKIPAELFACRAIFSPRCAPPPLGWARSVGKSHSGVDVSGVRRTFTLKKKSIPFHACSPHAPNDTVGGSRVLCSRFRVIA